jgi:serine protease Do
VACSAESGKTVDIAENKSTEHYDLAVNEQQAKLDKLNEEITNTRRNALTDAIKYASPAVVGINVTEVKQVLYRNPYDDLFSQFFRRYRSRPRVREYEVKSLGSGFLISSDGYILTNHHVAGNASKVIVTMTDGKEYEAEIIGADRVSDVALLKIEGKNLPHLKMCKSDVLIGEWAIALGNPFGLFDKNAKPTVTVGVVSNNGVDFIQKDERNGDVRVYRDMVQTDAAISSGNSGGPLINAMGEVIGMNTVIFSTANNMQGSGSIGIGFSIPVDRVQNIVDKFLNGEELNRDIFMGLYVRENNNKYQKMLGLDTDKGLIITDIGRKSPAIKAGLELGDLILSIDGYNVVDGEDFEIATIDKFVGDSLKFRILRYGKEMDKVLKLEQVKRRR